MDSSGDGQAGKGAVELPKEALIIGFVVDIQVGNGMAASVVGVSLSVEAGVPNPISVSDTEL